MNSYKKYRCTQYLINLINCGYSSVLLLAVCIVLFSGNSGKKSTSNITVSISLDKESYLVCEPLLLNVKFKNTSNQVDSILYLNEDEVASNIGVKNDADKKSDFKGAVVSYIRKSYRKLQPSEEVTFKIDLMYHYGFDRFVNKLVMGFFSYFSPGTYTVKSFFDGEFESENGKKLESNVLTFRVMEKELAEKENYNKLRSIYVNNISGGDTKQQEAIIQLTDLFVSYPESPYYWQAFYDLDFYRNKFNISFDAKTKDECLNFITNNPNSTYTREAVSLYGEVIYSTEGKQSAINKIKALKENNQNTKIADGVEIALNHSIFRDN
jgi:hypothetical protein